MTEPNFNRRDFLKLSGAALGVAAIVCGGGSKLIEYNQSSETQPESTSIPLSPETQPQRDFLLDASILFPEATSSLIELSIGKIAARFIQLDLGDAPAEAFKQIRDSFSLALDHSSLIQEQLGTMISPEALAVARLDEPKNWLNANGSVVGMPENLLGIAIVGRIHDGQTTKPETHLLITSRTTKIQTPTLQEVFEYSFTNRDLLFVDTTARMSPR